MDGWVIGWMGEWMDRRMAESVGEWMDGWAGGQIDLSPLLGTPLSTSYKTSLGTSQSSGSPDASLLSLLALILSGIWSLSTCSVCATFTSSWAYPLSDSGPGLPVVREQGPSLLRAQC